MAVALDPTVQPTKPNSMKELGLEHLEYFLQYRVEQGFGVYYIVNNRDLGYPQIM